MAPVPKKKLTREEVQEEAFVAAVRLGYAKLLSAVLESDDFRSSRLCKGIGDGMPTALSWAARKGMMDVARLLVKKDRFCVNVGSPGLTPLMSACWKGHFDMVDYLLSVGADPHIPCRKGKSALIYASEYGHSRCVQRLLEGGAESLRVDDADRTSKTALAYACLEVHVEIAWLLVLKGGANSSRLTAQHKAEVRARGNMDCLELIQAVEAQLTSLKQRVERGDLQGLRALLSPGALPALTQAVDGKGSQNLLMFAIEGKQTEAAMLLLERGAPVNWRSPQGNTALHEASTADEVRVASALLDRGASVGGQDHDGMTPFYLGCLYGHWGIVTLLLKCERFTPAMWRRERHEAMEKALQCDEFHTLDSMLRYGVGTLEHPGAFWASTSGRMLVLSMEERYGPMGCYKRTLEHHSEVLQAACASGDMRAVEARDESDAHLLYILLCMPLGQRSRTPLMTAAVANQVEVARVLLEHDRKAAQRVAERGRAVEGGEGGEKEGEEYEAQGIDAVDDDDATALRLASERGHVDMVRLLLEHGAKPRVDENVYGTCCKHQTDALRWACAAGHEEVVGLLLAKEGEVSAARLQVLINVACEADQEGVVGRLAGRSALVLRMALEQAATLGRMAILRRLLPLTEQEDVNLAVEQLSQALWCAAMEGQVEAANLLLEHGADTWVWSEDQGPRSTLEMIRGDVEEVTPGQLACFRFFEAVEARNDMVVHMARRGQLSELRTALGEGPHAWVRGWGSEGDTALIAAVGEGHVALVQQLLAWGAEVDLASRVGLTPLKVAAQCGCPAMIRVLCAAGASLHDSPERHVPASVGSYDPLSDASSYVESVEALLEAGADPRGQGAAGGLLMACRFGMADVVQVFLRAMGPDWTQVDRQRRALEVAAHYGHLKVVLALLLGRGSDDEATWRDMVQRAIARARRRRRHACLLTLELSLRDHLYMLNKARTIQDASNPQAPLPACLAKRRGLPQPQQSLPTVVVAAAVGGGSPGDEGEGEGHGQKTEVLVAVAKFVVSELKHDLYLELSDSLLPALEWASHEEEEEEEGWSGSEGDEVDEALPDGMEFDIHIPK